MDLQNCLNFQRELLYLPPSYPVANVTQRYRNASNPKKYACRKKKKTKRKTNKIKKTESQINHTDKNKTSINRTYCIMPFSWLEEKFKRFFSGSASLLSGARADRILNCNFIGWMWLRPPHSPAPVFHIRHRTK